MRSSTQLILGFWGKEDKYCDVDKYSQSGAIHKRLKKEEKQRRRASQKIQTEKAQKKHKKVMRVIWSGLDQFCHLLYFHEKAHLVTKDAVNQAR